MKTSRSSWEYKTGELRTKYQPPKRLGRGLSGMAPWLDIALIIIFFGIFEDRIALQPGVVINLPQTPFRDGVRAGSVAVVLSVAQSSGSERAEVVFFEDQAFRLDDPRKVRELGSYLELAASRGASDNLVIYADEDILHGTIMDLLSMAREAGFKTVNMASKP